MQKIFLTKLKKFKENYQGDNMFEEEILKKLEELDVNVITKVVRKARLNKESIMVIKAEPPYLFIKIHDDSKLNDYVREPSVIGYIKKNGYATCIIYCTDPEAIKRHNANIGRGLINETYECIGEIELNILDRVSTFHKPRPKETSKQKRAHTSIFDQFEEISKTPSHVFHGDYAKKNSSFYLYKDVLLNNENLNFNGYKYFKKYSTLLYIADKSGVIKHKCNTCHITPKDLTEIIPKSIKYKRKAKPEMGRRYWFENETVPRVKPYVAFLQDAMKLGLIKNVYNVKEYLSITFSETFMEILGNPPYIKVPFELLNDITMHNYNFIMFFIMRQFGNNPNKPYIVNIKIRKLLELAQISTKTSHTATVKRLNNYLSILKKYSAIKTEKQYTVLDIRKDALLSLRLYPFKPVPLSSEDYEKEIDTNTDIEGNADIGEEEVNDNDFDANSSEKNLVKPPMSEKFLRALKKLES